jgi:hypothetical protein
MQSGQIRHAGHNSAPAGRAVAADASHAIGRAPIRVQGPEWATGQGAVCGSAMVVPSQIAAHGHDNTRLGSTCHASISKGPRVAELAHAQRSDRFEAETQLTSTALPAFCVEDECSTQAMRCVGGDGGAIECIGGGGGSNGAGGGSDADQGRATDAQPSVDIKAKMKEIADRRRKERQVNARWRALPASSDLHAPLNSLICPTLSVRSDACRWRWRLSNSSSEHRLLRNWQSSTGVDGNATR